MSKWNIDSVSFCTLHICIVGLCCHGCMSSLLYTIFDLSISIRNFMMLPFLRKIYGRGEYAAVVTRHHMSLPPMASVHLLHRFRLLASERHCRAMFPATQVPGRPQSSHLRVRYVLVVFLGVIWSTGIFI
jgi:hypothetical protein